MGKEFAINIIIEREFIDKKEVFIASSPDINVFAEGESIDDAKKKFLEGVNSHLEVFPEEKECLVTEIKDRFEMPMLSRIFL